MRRAISAVAIVLLTAGASLAQTLTDSLIGAYRTSGLLEQNRALLRAADEDVAQAVATLRPVVEYIASTSYSESPIIGGATSTSAAVSARLLLFDFGQTQLSIDLQKETVLALREGLRAIEQQVLLRAVRAHLDVRRQEAFVSLRENNVRVLGEQLRATRDRFDVGEVTRTDVSIAEARLASARSSLAASRGDLARARAEYLSVVGSPARSLQPAPRSPSLPVNEAAAKTVANDRHPELLQARRDVTVAELGVAVAEAALRPSLSGTASVSLDNYGDTASSVGVELRGPIYRGGQLTSLIRQARARRDATRGALYTTHQDIEQGVSIAWADLAVALAVVEASRQEVRAAQLALRGAREELEVGSRTTLDVLDLEQELLDAQTNQVTANIGRNQAVYSVLASMGLLTAEYLQLGIATYDPAAYYNTVKGAPNVMVSPQGERLDRVLQRLRRN